MIFPSPVTGDRRLPYDAGRRPRSGMSRPGPNHHDKTVEASHVTASYEPTETFGVDGGDPAAS